MQKPFVSQPALFVTSADLEHPSLQGLDGAEAVLDWTALEQIMAGIYASKPSPLATRTTAPSATRFCWAMRRHFMRMRPIAQRKHGPSWKASASKIAGSARAIHWLAGHYMPEKRGHPISDADKARNAEIFTTRSGGERPFATYKSRYGLARTRLMAPLGRLLHNRLPVNGWPII